MAEPGTGPARFDDQVVIVTGGGRGLGLAIGEAFKNAGATVIFVGRNGARLRSVTDALNRSRIGHAVPSACDVTDEQAILDLVATTLQAHGRIDVLVNNAGINPWYRQAEDTSLAEWQAILDVNLTGPFLTCKHVGKVMLAAGRGAIVNISSIAGKVGLARTTAYCASKGGLELLTKALAVDWAARGVRVNAVSPGYFETDLTAGLQQNEALAQRVTGRTPMRRFGQPEEVAGACLFLASAAASYITGQSFGVDGGWTAA